MMTKEGVEQTIGDLERTIREGNEAFVLFLEQESAIVEKEPEEILEAPQKSNVDLLADQGVFTQDEGIVLNVLCLPLFEELNQYDYNKRNIIIAKNDVHELKRVYQFYFNLCGRINKLTCNVEEDSGDVDTTNFDMDCLELIQNNLTQVRSKIHLHPVYLLTFQNFLENAGIEFNEDQEDIQRVTYTLFTIMDSLVSRKLDYVKKALADKKKEIVLTSKNISVDKEYRKQELIKAANIARSGYSEAIIVRVYYAKDPAAGRNRKILGADTDGHASIEVLSMDHPPQYISVYPEGLRSRTPLEDSCSLPSMGEADAVVKTSRASDNHYPFCITVVIPGSDAVNVDAACQYLAALEKKYQNFQMPQRWEIPNGYNVASKNCSYYPFLVLDAADSHLNLPIVMTPNELIKTARILAAQSTEKPIGALERLLISHRDLLERGCFNRNFTLSRSYKTFQEKQGGFIANELFVEFATQNIITIVRLLEHSINASEIDLRYALLQESSLAIKISNDHALNLIIVFIKSYLSAYSYQVNFNLPELAMYLPNFEKGIAYINQNGLYSVLLDLVNPNTSMSLEQKNILRLFVDRIVAQDNMPINQTLSEFKKIYNLAMQAGSIQDAKDDLDRLRHIEAVMTHIQALTGESNSPYLNMVLQATKHALIKLRAQSYALILAEENDRIDRIVYAFNTTRADPNPFSDPKIAIALCESIDGIIENEGVSIQEKLSCIAGLIQDADPLYTALHVRAIVACVVNGLQNEELNLGEAIALIKSARAKINARLLRGKEEKALRTDMNNFLQMLVSKDNEIFDKIILVSDSDPEYSDVEDKIYIEEEAISKDDLQQVIVATENTRLLPVSGRVSSQNEKVSYQTGLGRYQQCIAQYKILAGRFASPENGMDPDRLQSSIESLDAFMAAVETAIGAVNPDDLITILNYKTQQLIECMVLMNGHLADDRQKVLLSDLMVAKIPKKSEYDIALNNLIKSGNTEIVAKALLVSGILFGIITGIIIALLVMGFNDILSLEVPRSVSFSVAAIGGTAVLLMIVGMAINIVRHGDKALKEAVKDSAARADEEVEEVKFALNSAGFFAVSERLSSDEFIVEMEIGSDIELPENR